jgi:hypothetical protein
MTEQYHRRSAAGGIALGLLASLIFLAAASVCAYFFLDLSARVYAAESMADYNAVRVKAWDAEIEAREADIEDLRRLFPSHAQPAPNPPSSNPTVPPPPHN